MHYKLLVKTNPGVKQVKGILDGDVFSMTEKQPTYMPGDRFAKRLRGLGPPGILAVLVTLAGNFIVVPLSAVLVLLWAVGRVRECRRKIF